MQTTALDRQREVYLSGFAGKFSEIPKRFWKLEKEAKESMSKRAFAYVAGGAGTEQTMDSNLRAFRDVEIVPRMLRDVSERDMSVNILGKRWTSPFFLCPIGVLELAHYRADLAVARAASSLDVPFIFSNQASVPMEETAQVMGRSTRWFQLYWSKSRELVASFVSRAEASGCEAIVVTLDTTMLGWRPRDLDQAYLPFLEGKGIAQYTSDPVFTRMLENFEPVATRRQITPQSLLGLIQMVNHYPGDGFFRKLKSGLPLKAVQQFISMYTNPGLTWEDLSFLREHTRLPVVLKGILHADDARRAVDAGIDAIIVSNHGGRQVNGSISSLEALKKIRAVVPATYPLLLDSGIRSGADVFKALAIGANAVGIGRPYVYGLAIDGERGVREVLKDFLADFELTMGLAGCLSVAEVRESGLSMP